MKVPPWCRMAPPPQGIMVEVVSERVRSQRVALDFKKDPTFFESASEQHGGNDKHSGPRQSTKID